MENLKSKIELIAILLALWCGFASLASRIDGVNSRFDQFIVSWHMEAKDFHGRLCKIEEARK